MNISFYGGIEGVTGSCYLLTLKKGRILVDAGLFQDSAYCSKANAVELPFDATQIDAVFVTHAHLDHTGRLPYLSAKGYMGPIYLTPPTKSLTRLVLEDALNVMRENAEKCGDDILYSPEDVQNALQLMKGVNYHTSFEPIPGVQAMFHNAGHILGSSHISFEIPGSETQDGKAKTIVFSGDVGNSNVPILPKNEPIHKADYIICESTYGDREHEPPEMRSKKLTAFVNKIIARKGTLIIPAFSIERTQELLYELDHLIETGIIPHVPVFLDSPLGIRATQVYRDFADYLEFDRSILTSKDRDFFSFRGLRETLSIDESKMINDHRESKIIISGAGMMNGGRVLHHLRRYLPDEKSGVLIVGYQAEGTLGRRIQDGQKEVTIYNDPIPVRADIEKIEAFSAHADRKTLRDWLLPEASEAEEILLVHGEKDTKIKFKVYLEEARDARIYIPKLNEVIEI